jgi:hypothetical protein
MKARKWLGEDTTTPQLGTCAGANSLCVESVQYVVAAYFPLLTTTIVMPQGDKSKYTDKQIRKAEHIEEGYEKQGLSEEEAERRAWATVNKQDGGGKKPGGSGRKSSK